MPEFKWYREGLRFECNQCGNCCSGAPGYVWLTREEIGKIAAHLGLEVKEFTRRYVRRVGFKHSLVEKSEKSNYDCIFLKRENRAATCATSDPEPWPLAAV